MKTLILFKHLFTPRLALALGLSFLASAAMAHPYASSLTNASGIISFRLNEAAESVLVVSSGGTVTNDLGALPQGLTVVNLGISGDFSVVVSKNGTGVPLEIFPPAANTNFSIYNSPRGVTVVTDPASPAFGRVYVANSAAGTSGGRAVGDGIYMVNADFSDALGQGNTARNGGIPSFGTGGASSPYRIALGPDGRLYVCDWSDAAGNLYVVDRDVSPGTFEYVLKPLTGTAAIPVGSANNHGSVAAVVVTGSSSGGDLTLYVVDEDYQTDPNETAAFEMNSLWRFDIGSGTYPWNDPPNQKLLTPTIQFVSQTMDLARGTNGYLYVSQRRSTGGQTGVYVVDEFGNPLWDSLLESFNLGNAVDFLRDAAAIAVSGDQKYLATMRWGDNVITVVPLTNGIPDLANRFTFTGFGTTAAGRGLAFDAANNVWVVTSGLARLKHLSLGLTTTAITSSTGTFELITPDTTVNVTLNDPLAYEQGQVPATFTITRSAADLANPLQVNFAFTGTATFGADYVSTRTNFVTIAAGETSTNVTITPVDDTIAELTETVILTIAGGPGYSPVNPATQTAVIIDNETPELRVTALSTNIYERLQYDHARLTIQRRGDTNVFLQVDQADLVISGSAVLNTDYTLANLPIFIEAGVVNTTVRLIYPIDNNIVDGPRTITVGLQAGTGFTVTTNTATTTITDDDLPPEMVLFSESFNLADTATNWNAFFADTNTPALDDYTLTFGYDYSALGIPPAPNGSDTLGVFMQVNKIDGDPIAAALNIYPKNKSFSGDYAVRFDMYMTVGAGSLTTEYALFGINHSGTRTNWFRNSAGGVPAGWTFDGLFYGVESDAAALGDYVLYSSPTTVGNNPTPLTPGRNASTLTQVFKSPPFFIGGTGAGGAPANPESNAEASWVDVEISQVGGVVTLKINRIVIFSYTNATPYTSGNIMLGYTDAYDSIGPAASSVIYDNLRVVSLAPPTVQITQIKIVGGNVEIDFTGPAGDLPSAYVLQEASVVTGPYSDVSATITGSGGTYKAVRALGAAPKFYRIKRL